MAEKLRKRGLNVDPERMPTGAEAVARELDELNAKHQRLLDMLYERLRRIAAANPGDIVTLVSDFNFFLIENQHDRQKSFNCLLVVQVNRILCQFFIIILKFYAFVSLKLRFRV